MEFGIVELSRLQFAMTAMYHFLFVPLTLGLSILVAIMETVYVMTNRPIWRQMTKFWGTLFGINFVLGVATGITMEFQFGMNWSYYSHYVGDIFGAPLAIEGLMAFFLEATFVGLFFFGWDKLSKVAAPVVAWLVAIGSNFSALWILIANGWMQNPVGAQFNPMTMRMEMTSISSTCCSTRWRRRSSSTRSRPVTSPPRSSCSASRPGTCCKRPPYRTGPALDRGCGSLRSRLGAVGRRAGRRIGLFAPPHPENEARRHRGHVGDRAGAGLLHRIRISRSGGARDPLCHPHPLGDGPDRHPLADHFDPRHRGTRKPGRNPHQIRHLIAYDALMTIREERDNADPGGNALGSRPIPPISASRSCSSAMSTIRARRHRADCPGRE
jgi:hypothetical protein